MKQFTYKEFKTFRDRDNDNPLVSKLNTIGKDGWEAIHIVDSGNTIIIIAKQEIPQTLTFNIPTEHTGKILCTPEGMPLLMGLETRKDL